MVRALSYRFPTAIVSGRARATAQGLMQLDGLYYAGSHGFDILGPDGSNYKMAESFRPSLEEAKVKLSGADLAVEGDETALEEARAATQTRRAAAAAARARAAAARMAAEAAWRS